MYVGGGFRVRPSYFVRCLAVCDVGRDRSWQTPSQSRSLLQGDCLAVAERLGLRETCGECMWASAMQALAAGRRRKAGTGGKAAKQPPHPNPLPTERGFIPKATSGGGGGLLGRGLIGRCSGRRFRSGGRGLAGCRIGRIQRRRGLRWGSRGPSRGMPWSLGLHR